MDPEVYFEHIDSPSVRQQLKDVVEEIVQFAPSDSSVRATFRFIQDKFLADVKIASTCAYMSAMDQASAVGELLENVKSNLMGQIVDWRIHRFAS